MDWQTKQKLNVRLAGWVNSAESKLHDLVLYEYVGKRFRSEKIFISLPEEVLIQGDWWLKVRRH